MKKYHCDHCEKEIPEIGAAIEVGSSSGDFYFVNHFAGKTKSNFYELHFCSEMCFIKSFTNFWTHEST